MKIANTSASIFKLPDNCARLFLFENVILTDFAQSLFQLDVSGVVGTWFNAFCFIVFRLLRRWFFIKSNSY